MESALPHVLLAVSAADRTAAREQIERLLAARHVSYGVHEGERSERLAATLCEADYAAVRAEIDACDGLTVVSEGREPDLRGADERPAPVPGADRDGGRRMKLVIVLTG